jgi:hypothetical protein
VPVVPALNEALLKIISVVDNQLNQTGGAYVNVVSPKLAVTELAQYREIAGSKVPVSEEYIVHCDVLFLYIVIVPQSISSATHITSPFAYVAPYAVAQALLYLVQFIWYAHQFISEPT